MPKKPRKKCEYCEMPAVARGMCWMHYHRWRKHGDPHTVLKSPGPKMQEKTEPCRICGAPAMHSRLCPTHYRRWQRYGDPNFQGEDRRGHPTKEVTKCSVPGCDRAAVTKGKCQTHYKRAQREANHDQSSYV